MTTSTAFKHLDVLAAAPEGVARLRQLILELAVQGKLVHQCPGDTPSSALLAEIQSDRARRIKSGEAKKKVPASDVDSAELPFPIPATWTWARLAMIADFENGDRGKNYPSRTSFVDHGIAFINAGHLSKERIDFSNMNYITPKTFGLLRSGKIQRGDILYCLRGSLGKFALVEDDIEGAIASSLVIVRLTKDIGVEYICLYLASPLAKMLIGRFDNGTAQPNLGAGDLSKFLVPLPPLDEQRRIVARVGELMKLCDALERNGYLADEHHARLTSTLLDALPASESACDLAEKWAMVAKHFDTLLDRTDAIDVFEQMIVQLAVRGALVRQSKADGDAGALLEAMRRVSSATNKRVRTALLPLTSDQYPFSVASNWTWTRFGEICDVSGGVTLGRKGTVPDPVTLPYLRVANVQRGSLSLEIEVKTVTVDSSELSRYRLQPGDLLITEGGDWDKVGRTCIWRGEIAACLHQNHVFKARGFTPEWLPEWGELYLNSPVARKYFAASSKQTTNLASINMSELRNCPFPLPPIAEQRRILARLGELRSLCADLRSRLIQARQKQATLAEALVAQATTC
jgi:type I restriction enzyme S subunit